MSARVTPAHKSSKTTKTSKPAAAPKRARFDGWYNVLTGLGDISRDKTEYADFQHDPVDQQSCEELWRGDDMAACIVETIPAEMLRQGFDISLGNSSTDKNESELLLKAAIEELEVIEKYQEVLCYERAYGGGAIFPGADDGQDPAEPLDLKRLRSLKWISVLEPRELVPESWYSDPLKPKLGQVERYRINPIGTANTTTQTGALIHESRLITFPGVRVTKRTRSENNSWGDSVLVRCRRVLSHFHQSWSSAAVLLADFAQAVLKMKGLADFLAANDTESVVNRAQGMDLARSVCRAVIIDSEEEFGRQVTPLTELPEMLDKFALRLSATARMPVSLLLGQSPAGLQATGASDIRFFYDRVKTDQTRRLKPRLERLIKMIMLAKQGPLAGNEPKNWSVTFPSLWQETEKEKAEIRKSQADADRVYMEYGVISPEEVARSRFGGDRYSVETSIDMKSRGFLESSNTPPATEVKVNKEKVGVPAEDLAWVISVNEARSQYGLGPLTLPSGVPDPEGSMKLAAYKLKYETPTNPGVEVS